MIIIFNTKHYSEQDVQHIANCAYKAGKGDWNKKMFFAGMMIGWTLMSEIAVIIFLIYKI